MSDSGSQAHPPVSLRELLTAQTVRSKVEAASWQEAAKEVGRLLVEAEGVEPRYVEAMKRVLQEIGPYVVLAPGIALLHARPEDGVIRPCLALATLVRPVEFGSAENDPVDLVFAFGAVDKSAHILALRELSLLLMNADAVSRLRSAANDQELFEALRSWPAGQKEV